MNENSKIANRVDLTPVQTVVTIATVAFAGGIAGILTVKLDNWKVRRAAKKYYNN